MFPIVTPGSMVALDPIHTFSPIVTGEAYVVFLVSKVSP
ncbi:hypothetical protein B4087_2668 [Bacillus cereus]|nr:hypothetical protein B4087_2668 [Bacillus cereus]